MDEENVILFQNESSEKVTVFFYQSCDCDCLTSWFSKVLEPGQFFLQRGDYKFKYQIKYGKLKTKVKPYLKNLVIKVRESVVEEDLNNDMKQKHIEFDNIRKAFNDGKLDLYATLNLDMVAIRKLSYRSQDSEIENAYANALRNYGQDGKNEDTKTFQEVDFAYEILKSRNSRIRFHNHFDKKARCCTKNCGSWCKVWSCPETENQACISVRVIAFLFSIISLGVGYWVSTCPSKLKKLHDFCSIIGFALSGAGQNGFGVWFSKPYNCCAWLSSLLRGIITGVLNSLFLLKVVTWYSPTYDSLSLTHFVQMGAIAGSCGAVLQSLGLEVEELLSNFFKRKKKNQSKLCNFSLRSAIIEITVSLLGGAVAGAAGGAISSKWKNVLSKSNVDEVVEAVFTRTMLLKCIRSISENGIMSCFNCFKNFVKERANSNNDNHRIEDHIITAAFDFSKNGAKDALFFVVVNLPQGIYSDKKVENLIKNTGMQKSNPKNLIPNDVTKNLNVQHLSSLDFSTDIQED